MNTPDLTAPGSVSARKNQKGQPQSNPSKIIRVVAVLVQDHNDNILLVRKKGTDTFIQPGGKPEPGEDTLTTAARELVEETGLVVGPSRFLVIGEFTAPAANEPGFSIIAQCVRVKLCPGEETGAKAAAEIAEATWFTQSAAAQVKAAPLFQDIILPIALGKRSN